MLLVAFFVLGAGWSLSTAPGGSPDEIQHAIRAITVWDGQLLLDPLPGGGAAVEIPQSWTQIQDGIRCFAGRGEKSAACEVWPSDQGPPVPAGNSAGRYNPTFYLLVGLPLRLFSAPEAGLHIARLLAALLSAVLLALAAGAIVVRGGSVMARVGLVAALTPMALFLGSTINPSGMEISGAVAGWVGLLLLARNPEHPAVRYFAVVTAVGLCSMVASRPASYLWLAVLGGVFLIAAGRNLGILLRRRAVVIAGGVVIVVTLLCLGWNWVARTSDVSTGAASFGGLAEGLRKTFLGSGDWWAQQVGVLGWLDTPLPTGVLWGTLLVAGVLVIPALAAGRPMMRLALAVAIAVAVVVPILAQTVLFPQTGFIWQGRYSMPLTVGVVIVAGLALDETSAFEARFAARLLRLCLAIWAFVGTAMGFYNLQRYATGSGENAGYRLFLGASPWEPPGGNTLTLLVIAAGYLAVALALARVGRHPRVNEEPGREPGPALGDRSPTTRDA